jgi:phage-related protein
VADELDPVEQQFIADIGEYLASMDEATATAQEFAGANEEAAAALDGIRDHAAEAGEALSGIRDGAAEASAADDALRDSAAETATALGHLRDEAIEAAAAMHELRDSEVEAGAAGAAAEGGGLSMMAVGITALIGLAAAIAPAALAAGAAFGAFALFAAPTIMQVAGALGDTKAQLAKLPGPIQAIVAEVKNVEAEWKSLSAQFALPVENMISQALGDISDLLPKLVPLAQTGMKAMQGLVDAIGKGIDSKGFSDFLSMMNRLAGPALNALGQLAGTIGGILLHALEELAPYAVPMINMLNGLLKAAGPALVNGLKFIAQALLDMGKAVTPLLGPLGKVFGYLDDHPIFAQIAAGLLGIAAAVKIWTIAQGLLNIVLDANPIILIGAAIALLALLILTHTHQISEAFDAVRHAIATFGHDVASVFDKVRHDIAAAVDYVISFVKSHWVLIVAILTGPVGLAVAELVKHWNTIKADVTRVIGDVINWVRDNWKNIVGWLADPMGMAVMEIRQHWGDIEKAFTEGWHAVLSVLDGLRHDIAAAWDAVRHDVAAAVDAQLHDLETAFDNIRHGVAAIVMAIPGDIEKAWDTVRHDAAALGDDVLHQLEAAWDAVYSATSKAVSEVLSFFEKLPGQVTGFLASLPGQMLSIGENVIKGLINGILNAAAQIPSIMSGLASDVASYFTDPLKLFSPSRLFFEHGFNIVQGAINGVKANAPNLLATMRGLGTSVGAAGTGSVLAAGAIGAGGSSSVHVTVPVTVQGGTSGVSPQYLQSLQATVQEAVLRHAQMNPTNGLVSAWGHR